ncbi:TonB-dependent receptor [Sediminicoccus rosea]|jgi:outer membrane receptor protein involved in Fe transport|uniref:TonB-dependent receptor n=1 Tax=Sediminicoccus rosea TaxID=1225128 RepID=A0ABZ0PFL5_9PROT|nr:TonB-dependent receptor [Sediminicoccus rosea]WPB84480.1 TonB-dependent receptor [Sediminicoccus rosea]
MHPVLRLSAAALGLGATLLPARAEEAVEVPDTVVQARRLDAARNTISPTLGATVSTLDRNAIEGLPQGVQAPINELLLTFPGVVQDSFGEIHIRGEHRNLQYRINGVTIPEGIQGFGAFLDARGVRSLSLLTGSLPAQFGYRTGGVVDVNLISGASNPGGWASIYGGSFRTFQPSIGYAGVFDGWDVFAMGTAKQSLQGIEPPTGSYDSIHNRTNQYRGLLSVSRPVTESTRISFIGGASANRFQMPNNPGQPQEYPVNGITDFDSARLNAHQWERNQFGIVALQGSEAALDWQVAGFARRSSTKYIPDVQGELAFNGVASGIQRLSQAAGVQADASYRLNAEHTLRFGLMTMAERVRAWNTSFVFPIDADGEVLDAQFPVINNNSRTSWLYGIYLQDEWRITDRFTLNFGLRGDYADQAVQAGQVSPRINAVWRPWDGTTLTLGYARYFTPPAQDLITPFTVGQFADTTGAPPGTTGATPRPERSNYFSAGISQRVTPELTLGSNAWYKQATDMLDLGQFGRALVFTPFNYARGQSYGIEFTGQWTTERLSVFANLTLSRATGTNIRSSQFNFDPEELSYIAGKYVRTDHDQLITASGGISYRPWEGARASATAFYGNGLRRGFANSEKQPAYATMNLGFAQEFRAYDGGAWTARVDLINVTDQVVQLRDGSGIGVGAPQFLPRRAIYAGLSRAF